MWRERKWSQIETDEDGILGEHLYLEVMRKEVRKEGQKDRKRVESSLEAKGGENVEWSGDRQLRQWVVEGETQNEALGSAILTWEEELPLSGGGSWAEGMDVW